VGPGETVTAIPERISGFQHGREMGRQPDIAAAYT